jgi:hypothetical protein
LQVFVVVIVIVGAGVGGGCVSGSGSGKIEESKRFIFSQSHFITCSNYYIC